MHGNLIHNISNAKYLWIPFDEHLTWKTIFIASLIRPISALAFLRRNINYCPISVKSHCYKSFVRPLLECGLLTYTSNVLSWNDTMEPAGSLTSYIACQDHYSLTSVLWYMHSVRHISTVTQFLIFTNFFTSSRIFLAEVFRKLYGKFNHQIT